MAFHRIGDTILSDEELRSHNAAVMSFLIPAVVTGIGEYFLYSWLSPMAFFVIHTTTAKTIYLLTGIILFGLGYYYRKAILATVVSCVVICMFVVTGLLVWQWLMS